jgi:UDP-glucose 4-epimerase
VVASADVLRETLGWEARHDVRQMVASAWEGWTALVGDIPARV